MYTTLKMGKYTIGEADLEVADAFADFEASGEHFIESTDERVTRRQYDHLSAEHGHPRLKHLPWRNGEQGPTEMFKGSINDQCLYIFGVMVH